MGFYWVYKYSSFDLVALAIQQKKVVDEFTCSPLNVNGMFRSEPPPSTLLNVLLEFCCHKSHVEKTFYVSNWKLSPTFSFETSARLCCPIHVFDFRLRFSEERTRIVDTRPGKAAMFSKALTCLPTAFHLLISSRMLYFSNVSRLHVQVKIAVCSSNMK